MCGRIKNIYVFLHFLKLIVTVIAQMYNAYHGHFYIENHVCEVGCTPEVGCHTSRTFWKKPNLPRSRRLIKLNRAKLSTATKIITGRCLTGRHAERFGLTHDKSCRRCGISEDTFSHMLCNCPYLDKLRYQYTGFTRFTDLQEASRVRIPDLIRFFEAARPEVV